MQKDIEIRNTKPINFKIVIKNIFNTFSNFAFFIAPPLINIYNIKIIKM